TAARVIIELSVVQLATTYWTLPQSPRGTSGTAATAVEVDWRLAAGPGPWTAGGSTPVVGGVASVVLNGFPGNQGIEFRYRPTAGGALGDWSTLGPLTATLPVPDPVVLTSTLSSVSACPSEADSALMTACYDNVAQTLTWPTPSDNGVAITGYEVESTVDGVTWAPRAGLPAGTNSLIVDQAYRQAAGITAVQSYRVRLRAVSASGAGSWGTNGMGAHCATGAFTAGPCALSTLSRSGDGTTATITAKTIIAPSYPLVDTVEYGYRLPADLPAATVVAGTAPVVGVAPVTATFTLPDSTVTYVVSVRGVAGGTPGPWQDGTFAGYVPPGAPGGGSGSGSGGGDSTPSTSTTPGTSATQSAPDTTATPTASPDDLSAWVVGARMATGFKKRSGILRPKAKKNIDSFIESLSPGMTIGVYGFSPSTSNTTAANASRLRANRVAAYLRAHGVPVVHVSKGLSRKDARIAFGPGSRIQHNRTVVMLGLTPLPVTEQAPLPTDPDLELPGTARHLEDGKPLDTQTNPGSDAGGDVAGEIASVAPNYRLGVAFAHGSATLNSKSIRAGFAEFVAHAKEAGLSGPVAVYGHAGAYECKTEAACTRLSQKRASALAAELRDMGIRIARVDVVGWGQMPVATSLGQTTPHNRAAVMTAAVTWPTDSVAPALIRAAQSTKELS
ncbi:MAG: hypothetical protein QG661_3154, partial [Actinomycetota bacterium]|nr:hypothetical protein [Actinomycetota bacterium]